MGGRAAAFNGKGTNGMSLISTHRTQWRPANGLLYLRDVDADAGVGSFEAIAAAARDVAASTGYEIVVRRRQGLLLVGIELQTWDGPPDQDPAGDGWTGPLTFPLECPSGELFLSDTSDVALSGIAAPQGPGDYTVQVFYAGREDAVAAYRAIIAEVDRLPIPEQLPYVDEHAYAIERYLLRLYPARSPR